MGEERGVLIVEEVVPPETFGKEIDRETFIREYQRVKEALSKRGIKFEALGSAWVAEKVKERIPLHSDIDLAVEDVEKAIEALKELGYREVPESRQGYYIVRDLMGNLYRIKILPQVEWLVKEVDGKPFFVNLSSSNQIFLHGRKGEPLVGRVVKNFEGAGVIYKLLRGTGNDIEHLRLLAEKGLLADLLERKEVREILATYRNKALDSLAKLKRRVRDREVKHKLSELINEVKGVSSGVKYYPVRKWKIPVREGKPYLPPNEELIISPSLLRPYLKPLDVKGQH